MRLSITSARFGAIFAVLAFLLGSSLSAQVLDTTNAKASFTAFKTAKKVGVDGTFNNIAFKFKKGDSIALQLEGASATMDALAVNLGDEAKDKSVKESFFSAFKQDKKGRQLIKVTFRNVLVGENLGTMLATISMNGRTQKIPMQYVIENGTLSAKGVIDVLDFGLDEAFGALAKACEKLHDGMSWSQVEIRFTAPVK